MSELEQGFLALLDRIEVEEDYTLASQRFDLVEMYGYTVHLCGEASQEKH